MQALPNLIFFLAVLLAGCGAKSELPIQTKQVVISGSPTEVICRMRLAARLTGLSFHFGHNQANDVIAFRLISTEYEMEAINWTGKADYEFRLYVPSKDDQTIAVAKSALARLNKAVSAENDACR